MNLISWLMALLGIAVGAVGGVLLYARWLRQKDSEKLRIPHKWPLAVRGMVTNDEHEVWKWLRNTFHDHAVMVKLPVLRFTIPVEKDKDKEKNKEKNARLLELLNGVYTTFTICTLDGKVVGCVDLRGTRDVSRASRQLKETQQEAAQAAATRNIGFASDGGSGLHGDSDDRFAVPWEDSFIQPADTRPAKLE